MIEEFITRYKPCEEAVDYLRTQPDLETAWQNCQRADWMLWALCRVGQKYNGLLAACAVVRNTLLRDGRTVWDLLTDERSRTAIETVEAHVRGEVNRKELESVRDAAYAAVAAAYAAAYAAAAAHTVAYAADAADAAQAEIVRNVVPTWELSEGNDDEHIV